MCFFSALVCLVIASFAQASSVYKYATGSNLLLSVQPQDFVGIKDLLTLSQGSSPFDLSSVTFSRPSSITHKERVASVQTYRDYKSAFSLLADAQGSYSGISGSASAKYAQTQTLTATSSLYMIFLDVQLGDVSINLDANLTKTAEAILLNDPSRFVDIYGLYYIYGATVGCQASSTVRVTAKSIEAKKDIDAAAKASYQNIFSGSVNFTAQMESTEGFSDLSINVFTHGGNVSAVASSIEEVRTKILDPLRTDGACSSDNAVVSRALVRSWLSQQAIASLASKNESIIHALTPPYDLPPNNLRRINQVILESNTLLDYSYRCRHNVFSCVTQQWNESTTARESYYANAWRNLTEFQSAIGKLNQTTLTSDTVLNYEEKLDDIYNAWLKPAEALSAFTFTFKIRVLNWYDSYEDPPPYGTNTITSGFTINPNYQDTLSHKIVWSTQPQLDNGHSNCRHFYGHFHASFESDTLSVWQTWNRVCGWYNQKTAVLTFKPGGDTQGSTEYGDTVRTVYSFGVTYEGPLREDPRFPN